MEFTKETIIEFEIITSEALINVAEDRLKPDTLTTSIERLKDYVGLLENNLKVIIQEKNKWKETANKHQT